MRTSVTVPWKDCDVSTFFFYLGDYGKLGHGNTLMQKVPKRIQGVLKGKVRKNSIDWEFLILMKMILLVIWLFISIDKFNFSEILFHSSFSLFLRGTDTVQRLRMMVNCSHGVKVIMEGSVSIIACAFVSNRNHSVPESWDEFSSLFTDDWWW